MTIFYDSANPGKIPAGARACLYYDGKYTPTPAEVKRLGPVRWITVLGGAAAAAHTGCIDYEPGNEAYAGTQLRQWAQGRLAMKCRARVYCSRSDLKKAYPLVGHMPNVVWWIASLDNHERTAPDLLANIAAETGIHLPPATLWAQQYAGGPTAPYDTSVLYGVW